MSNQNKFTKENLFENTDKGLMIFEKYISGAEVYARTKKKFKLRETDRTPSTSIYLSADDIYMIKDHGGDKAKNAIDYCMQEENFTFTEALQYLYKEFNLTAFTPEKLRAKRTFKKAKEEIGFYKINYAAKAKNLEKIAPFLDEETCLEYSFKSVESYEYVSYKKDGDGNPTEELQLNIVEATEHYPIFAFYGEGWEKIYEPLNDKSFRFRFFGKKPTRIVYGWERLFNQVDYDEIISLNKRIKDCDASDRKYKKELEEERDEIRLDKVIIATGGSDGLNIASLGNDVIWFNSESEQLSFEEWQKLSVICKTIYNLPDIDKTGIRQAVALGLTFLDLKTIWLPAKLAEQNKKDFRDWIASYKSLDIKVSKSAFEKLLHQALQFKFWKWNPKTGAYKYVYDSLLYFLEHQGFFVYKINHINNVIGNIETIFIKIDGNIIKEVSASDIKSYVINWLKDNHVSRDVLNMVIPSQFLSEKSLMALPSKMIDFSDADASLQYFYFQNKIAKVTKAGIQYLNQGEIPNYTWNSNVIPHRISKCDPHFTIFKDQAGNWDINITKTDSAFFNYLINTSRIHWRNETELPFKDKTAAQKKKYYEENKFNIAGSNLSPDEIHEQKLHLINKIYSIGYLLHNYKDGSKPWAVYAMDNKIPDIISESHGGSGKSFCISSLLHLLIKRKYIKGRDPEITKNQFIYDGIDENTKLVFIDDGHYSLNMNFFFSELTGSLNVNPKFGKPFEIPFDKSPKFAISTNFAPRDLDPSTLRRLLFMVFSDWYHEQNSDYLETRQITDDFDGRKMFENDFTEKEYNWFFNFCLECLATYLEIDAKVNAPEGNVKKRNLLHIMGDGFFDFAKSYFGDTNYDTWIPRKEVQEEYRVHLSGKSGLTVNNQKKALEAFCEFNGWKLEVHKNRLQPEDYTRLKITPGSVVEKYKINTTGRLPEFVEELEKLIENDGIEPETDLPF